MSSSNTPHRLISTRQRLAVVVAASTVTASLFSALMLTFHGASPALWLAPTPELLAQADACAQQTERALRERCRQDLLAARIAQLRQPPQLAQR